VSLKEGEAEKGRVEKGLVCKNGVSPRLDIG